MMFDLQYVLEEVLCEWIHVWQRCRWLQLEQHEQHSDMVLQFGWCKLKRLEQQHMIKLEQQHKSMLEREW